MKIRMTIELDYDDEIMHGNDEDARKWFFDGILCDNQSGTLTLVSNILGDGVGVVRIKSIESC